MPQKLTYCCLMSYLNVGCKLLSSTARTNTASSRQLSSAASHEGKARRNFLFTQEQKRQRENVGRIEKIEVQYVGTPENVSLVMNKDISTPYNCAQHISEMVFKRSALALVNDGTLWDMHRPLETNCKLELLHFKVADPYSVNKAFWRTCSMILGAVAERCFKANIEVKLHSFPSPNVRSGSFVYDVAIPSLADWQPTTDELRIISSEMVNLRHKELRLERLTVSAELAQDMFSDNEYKSAQIPHIASQMSSTDQVVLYRAGEHVDVSRGPMIADTSFLGRCTVAAVHKIDTDSGNLYRFQGVALPKGFLLNHFAYSILEGRAKKLNAARLPTNSSKADLPFTEAVTQ